MSNQKRWVQIHTAGEYDIAFYRTHQEWPPVSLQCGNIDFPQDHQEDGTLVFGPRWYFEAENNDTVFRGEGLSIWTAEKECWKHAEQTLAVDPEGRASKLS